MYFIALTILTNNEVAWIRRVIRSILKENNVYFEIIGFTQNEFFEIEKELKISINDLFKINNQWYNNY